MRSRNSPRRLTAHHSARDLESFAAQDDCIRALTLQRFKLSMIKDPATANNTPPNDSVSRLRAVAVRQTDDIVH
jgi:hypothetical protein